MKVRPYFLLVLTVLVWSGQMIMAESAYPPLLYAAEGVNKIIRYDSAGTATWEYPADMSRDVWALPNGNVLFCFNRNYDASKHDNPSGVIEVTPEKSVVFEFSTVGQVWSCQRLGDGTTLVGAASQGKLLLVSPAGKVVKAIQVLNAPGHSCMRNARQTPDGRFLVAEESAHAAREYTADGELLREIKLTFAPFSVVRLESGNTIICGEQTMIDVDPTNRIVWSIQGKDLPDLGVRWFAGLQVLPNGNLFICNAGGKVPFLEFSREKGIVWQSAPNLSFPLGHGIQRLDIKGWPRK